MQPDADHDRDLTVGDPARAQLLDERRHQDGVRRRAREVGDRDDGLRFARSGSFDGRGRERAERCGSERRGEPASRLRGEIVDRRRRPRLDRVDIEPGLDHEVELLLPVRDGQVPRAIGHG